MTDYVKFSIDGWSFSCYGSYTPSCEGRRDSQGFLEEDHDEGDFDCEWFGMSKGEAEFTSLDLPAGFISSEFWKLLDDTCYYKLEDERNCQHDD